MNRLKIVIFSTLFILCLASCTISEVEIIRSLSIEKKSLECEMESLKLRGDSLWDEMGKYLAENLPADMPVAERTNMAATRSAHLIGLFKAFPRLDTDIRTRVNEAGKVDGNIAEKMKSVMHRLHETEEKINRSLARLENRSQQKFQQLKLELEELEKQPCHS